MHKAMLTQDKGAQPTWGGGVEGTGEEGKAAPEEEEATRDLSSLQFPLPCLPLYLPLLSTYYVPGWDAH